MFRRQNPLTPRLNAGSGLTSLFVTTALEPSDPPSTKSKCRRRPFFIPTVCLALLGRDVQHGIVGLGNTVENALRAFDLQYCIALRSPEAQGVTAKVRGHGGK